MSGEFPENDDLKLNYIIDFTEGAKVTIKDEKVQHGKLTKLEEYNIIFTDKDTGKVSYSTKLKPGSWARSNEKYFKNWNIKIIGNRKLLKEYNINLNNKKVLIRFQSKSLGDSIAWIPYVEEFRKKHNCEIYCSTFLNDLYKDEYKNVNFVAPGFTPSDIFAIYDIGWFNPMGNLNPIDYKTIPLQQTATDILGLEYKEIKPLITKSEKDVPMEKYVCIGEFSTANSKHWHYPYINSNKGWQILVDWLVYNGYKVVVISKQHTQLVNVMDRTGNFPLDYRILELLHCDFYIGVGSGLSWLAWSLDKKVVMISGFSDPICEFKENNIRIINKDVCNSCFNKYQFERGDWNWCPLHKNTDRQFECTKSITPRMVVNKIVGEKLVIEKEGFDFQDEIKNVDLNESDIEIKYDTEIKKLTIHYLKNEPMNNIHVDIKDENNKIITTLRNSTFSKDFVVWTMVSDEFKSNLFILNFFNDTQSMLKLNYMI